MTIRKGVDWGTTAPTPATLALVRSDSELREFLSDARLMGVAPGPFGLLGGDLMRTVGGSGDESRLTTAQDVTHLTIDAVRVIADDMRIGWFAAHCVIRHGWWRNTLIGAFNAQFLGSWDVCPRGHPNDGKIDIITVSAAMSIRQRVMARQRLPLGIHVPHPQIIIRQSPTTVIMLDKPMKLWLDGQTWGSAQRIEFVVEPDSFVVCV